MPQFKLMEIISAILFICESIPTLGSLDYETILQQWISGLVREADNRRWTMINELKLCKMDDLPSTTSL